MSVRILLKQGNKVQPSEAIGIEEKQSFVMALLVLKMPFSAALGVYCCMHYVCCFPRSNGFP